MKIKCKEFWKPISGYEGLYEISNYGNVYSIKNNKILKPSNSRYLQVILSNNGKTKAFSIHKLNCNAFLPNPNNYPCINHKDFNKHNNLIWVNDDGSIDYDKSNLEWCTYKYNLEYSNIFELANLGAANKLSKQILQIDKNNNIINEFSSAYEAERACGINNSNIRNCCNRKRKSAGGYIWKYKSEA